MDARDPRRLAAAILAAPILAAAPAHAAPPPPVAAPPGFVQPRDAEGRFQNLDGKEPPGFGSFLRWQWDRLLGRSPPRSGAPAPRVEPDLPRLGHPPGPGQGARLTWLGHASWLVQLEGKSFLVDPVLSDSIPGFIDRLVPPGVAWDRLPPIDAVLVSHNHYDHLDLPTLERVKAPVIAGLGSGPLLRKAGLAVTELSWWESAAVGDVRITFVPSQHFSQRGLSDRGKALWGGFVLEGHSAAVYHSGDTAFFPGFAEIGARFRLDAALLPIGAYQPRWFMSRVHVDPEEALQAFQDLRATTFLAMHWGTFRLAEEPLDEPPRRLEAERRRLGLAVERVRVLRIGESHELVRAPPPPAEPPPPAVPSPEGAPGAPVAEPVPP